MDQTWTLCLEVEPGLQAEIFASTDCADALISVSTQAPNLAVSLSHPLNPTQPTTDCDAALASVSTQAPNLAASLNPTQPTTDCDAALVSVSTQAPNLAASLSHPLNPTQPTMLFNAHIQPLPLSAATVTLGGPVSSASVSTMATGVNQVDSKPGRVKLKGNS